MPTPKLERQNLWLYQYGCNFYYRAKTQQIYWLKSKYCEREKLKKEMRKNVSEETIMRMFLTGH